MMKTFSIAICIAATLLTGAARGQTPGPNLSQQLAFAGLLSVNGQGQFNGVRSDASGNLYLLLNEGDGVRVLKTDNAAANVLAQAHLGAAGDIGLALTLDAAGNVYVAGTTTSTTLTGTSGAAIPNRTDSSTNSFVAKFDGSLNQIFVSFTGGSRIVATGIAATSDAVFVTGSTYAANLPVTPSGIQQAPAFGSSQNGFVERFSADGGTLVYATYLTGAEGNTAPAAVAADGADDAYIVGSTTASGFPTIAAVVPSMLGSTSGFLTKLTPAGDGIAFSTFVPGGGLTSIALDGTGQTLLLSGAVALGQFPVDTVAEPPVPATYQVLVKMPLDGSGVNSSTLLVPGTASTLTPVPGGAVWVDGVSTSPLLPLTALSEVGFGFALRVNAQNAIDQTARFGGLPNGNASYASLPLVLAGIAVDPAGEAVVAGGVQPTASASLLASESYDLPLLNAPTNALPSGLSAAIPASGGCSGSICPGSAAYAAKVSPAAGVALSVSTEGAPSVVLRNLGSAEATNLQIAASGMTVSNNCGVSLYAGGECNLLLSGGGPGTLTVSATGAATQTVAFAAFNAAPASTIVLTPHELDFGIETSTSAARTATMAVSNLGTQTQSFVSELDASGGKTTAASPFTQASTDCTYGGTNTLTLAAGGVCHVTLAFTASTSASSDGFVQAEWLIGSNDVLLTGYSEAASVSLSANELDFGTQFVNGLRLARYLYISNNSAAAVSHAAIELEAGSPFTLSDGCPEVLEAHTVCRIVLGYRAANAPSSDAVSLTLDDGQTVLVTGETLPQPTANASSANPNLSVSTTSVVFANAVNVTGISSETQTVTISNTGGSAFALTMLLAGDFTEATGCGATLAAHTSCNVVLNFVPSQPGTRTGLLAITAGSGTTPVYVAIDGTGTAILPANNGSLTFPATIVEQPSVQWYKVAESLSSLSVATSGPFAALLVEDIGYGYGEPAATAFTAKATGTCHNCYLGVQFTPTAAGMETGTLTLTSAAGGSPYTVTLNGIGVASNGLVLTPLNQDFGPVPVHSASGPTLFALTNSTGAAVSVSAPAFTGDFALSSAVTGGQACAGTLADTATCYFEAVFAPSAGGARSGSVSVSTSGGAATAALTGFGSPDPGVSLNPASLSFGNVPGTTATVQTIAVGNTGAATIQIGSPTTATGNFRASSGCGSLAPGATCSIAVTFLPTTSLLSDSLTLPVTVANGSSAPSTTTYTVPLRGAYTSEDAGLQILPAQAEYGPQATGSQGSTRQFTINNLTAKTLALSVDLPRQFVLVGQPCTALAPQASCSFSVAFLPLTDGDVTGTLLATGVPSDGSATVNGIAYVEGYGAAAGTMSISGALVAGPLLDFGQVTSGQSATQILKVTNGGSSTLTVRRITSDPPFTATSTCGGALGAAQSCTVSVTYSPMNQIAVGTPTPASRDDSGTLIIESDAVSSPAEIDLAGMAAPLAVSSPANATPFAALALSQGSLSFLPTPVGDASPAQTVTLTDTGTASVTIAGTQATPDFSVVNNCGTLVAGASCTITVTSTPQTAGTHIAALEISSNAVTGLDFVSLLSSGGAAGLTLNPNSLNFGNTLVGTTATLPVTVTNAGASAVTFNGLSATGDYTVGGNCPAAGATLAAAASCTLQVVFTPSATGTRAGTLSLASSASSLPLTDALTGVGTVSNLQIAPSSLSFGSVNQGASSTLSLTLTNTGSGPVNNLALAITGDYAIAAGCASTTLAPAASCSVQIAFTPTAAGGRIGTLTVSSSDSGSPATVPLTGIGVAVGGFTVTVDGSGSSSISIPSGAPATYQLAVTPQGGYTGSVALTCAAISPGPYATCSLSPSTLTLANGTQTAVATINTITSIGGNAGLARRLGDALLCLLAPGFLLTLRRPRARRLLAAAVLAVLIAGTGGCGGKGGNPSTTRSTPAGTYRYQVTANSTSGLPIAQTVNLTLVVQ